MCCNTIDYVLYNNWSCVQLIDKKMEEVKAEEHSNNKMYDTSNKFIKSGAILAITFEKLNILKKSTLSNKIYTREEICSNDLAGKHRPSIVKNKSTYRYSKQGIYYRFTKELNVQTYNYDNFITQSTVKI